MRHLPVLIPLVAVLLAGCDSSAKPAAASASTAAPAASAVAGGDHTSTHLTKRDPPPPSPKREGKVKTLRDGGVELALSDITVKAGKSGQATIEIKPTDKWKINTDYPTRVSLSGMTYAVTPDLSFSSAKAKHKEMFRATSGGIRIDIPFTGDAPGSDEVHAKVRLGICQTTCEIREFDATMTVHVVAPG